MTGTGRLTGSLSLRLLLEHDSESESPGWAELDSEPESARRCRVSCQWPRGPRAGPGPGHGVLVTAVSK